MHFTLRDNLIHSILAYYNDTYVIGLTTDNSTDFIQYSNSRNDFNRISGILAFERSATFSQGG